MATGIRGCCRSGAGQGLVARVADPTALTAHGFASPTSFEARRASRGAVSPGAAQAGPLPRALARGGGPSSNRVW